MIGIIYVICYIARIIEYFFIRTDKTIIGEAFIHKIFGIVVLIIALSILHMTLGEIGFKQKRVMKMLLYGLGFGLVMYVLGYGTEIAIAMASGNFVSLDFYVSSYAVDTNVATGTGIGLLIICIIGNILNVLMEEGVFRGLFLHHLEKRMKFAPAAIISSTLFGFWHVVGPIRNYMDGVSSLNSTVANIIMLVVTSGLVGLMFCMMKEITNSLYFGMAAHFVNNTIVNLLHVTTKTGVDEMMFVRITITQTISFCIILAVMLWKRKNENRF